MNKQIIYNKYENNQDESTHNGNILQYIALTYRNGVPLSTTITQ